MTHDDLKAWRTALGLSQRAAAEGLGVSLPTYQAMERGSSFATGKPVVIDRRTALACAAIVAGLPAWGEGAQRPAEEAAEAPTPD